MATVVAVATSLGAGVADRAGGAVRRVDPEHGGESSATRAARVACRRLGISRMSTVGSRRLSWWSTRAASNANAELNAKRDDDQQHSGDLAVIMAAAALKQR